MSEAIENMLTRRSVRKHKADMVLKETIEQIMNTGLYAAHDLGAGSCWILRVYRHRSRQ